MLGEGGEEGKLEPGKSTAFAILEVCVMMLGLMLVMMLVMMLVLMLVMMLVLWSCRGQLRCACAWW